MNIQFFEDGTWRSVGDLDSWAVDLVFLRETTIMCEGTWSIEGKIITSRLNSARKATGSFWGGKPTGDFERLSLDDLNVPRVIRDEIIDFIDMDSETDARVTIKTLDGPSSGEVITYRPDNSYVIKNLSTP